MESPCPFGFIGFSSGTSKSILHPSLPSETKLNNLIACGHTCVNGFDRVAAAISGLAEAVRSLAFELGRARRPVTLEREEAHLGEEQSFCAWGACWFQFHHQVPGGRRPSTNTRFFLVLLAKKKLRSAADSAEDRARAAFSAGYSCTCEVSLTSSYNPVLPPSTWLVQKDRGVSNFARTSARKEAEKELSLLSASLQSLSSRSFALGPRSQFHPL